MAKILFYTIILSIFFCFVPNLSAQQMDDVVYLKNGSIIHGIIFEQIPNVSIKIQTKDGNIFVYKTEDIMKITREPLESGKVEVKAKAKAKEEESATETMYEEGEKFPIGKGSALISGNVSLTNQSGDLAHATTTTVSPSILYFVSKGFGLGIDGAFTNTSNADERAVAVGPKLAYFIGGPQSKLFPYLGASVLYINLSAYDANASGYAINFNGGICPLIGKNGCATIEVGYTLENITIEGYYEGIQWSSSVSGSMLSLGIGIGIFAF